MAIIRHKNDVQLKICSMIMIVVKNQSLQCKYHDRIRFSKRHFRVLHVISIVATFLMATWCEHSYPFTSCKLLQQMTATFITYDRTVFIPWTIQSTVYDLRYLPTQLTTYPPPLSSVQTAEATNLSHWVQNAVKVRLLGQLLCLFELQNFYFSALRCIRRYHIHSQAHSRWRN